MQHILQLHHAKHRKQVCYIMTPPLEHVFHRPCVKRTIIGVAQLTMVSAHYNYDIIAGILTFHQGDSQC